MTRLLPDIPAEVFHSWARARIGTPGRSPQRTQGAKRFSFCPMSLKARRTTACRFRTTPRTTTQLRCRNTSSHRRLLPSPHQTFSFRIYKVQRARVLMPRDSRCCSRARSWSPLVHDLVRLFIMSCVFRPSTRCRSSFMDRTLVWRGSPAGSGKASKSKDRSIFILY